MPRTITDSFAEVPEENRGYSRRNTLPPMKIVLWKCNVNWNYPQDISWKNRPEPDQGLWMGARVKPRIDWTRLSNNSLTSGLRKNLGSLSIFTCWVAGILFHPQCC